MKIRANEAFGIIGTAAIIIGLCFTLAEKKTAALLLTIGGLWGTSACIYFIGEERKIDEIEKESQRLKIQQQLNIVETDLKVTKLGIEEAVQVLNNLGDLEYARVARDAQGHIIVISGDIRGLKPRQHFYSVEKEGFEDARHIQSVFSKTEISQADGDR